MAEKEEKKKVVALLSGGLDSTLAVKAMQKQGFEVSAVAIKTPFCDFDCGRGCGFLHRPSESHHFFQRVLLGALGCQDPLRLLDKKKRIQSS